MTEHVPARRGRPPTNEAAPVENSAPVEEAAQKPPVRRRRSSVGGHAFKLSAPERPGFVRRFFNDTNNRLAEAQDLGYTFVEERGIQTADPSSRVNRLAGTQANGAPIKTYLMETPDELYAQGVAEKEARCAEVDQAIREGRDSTGQTGPASETYGQGSITRSSG